jgi:hypothetical protein
MVKGWRVGEGNVIGGGEANDMRNKDPDRLHAPIWYGL